MHNWWETPMLSETVAMWWVAASPDPPIRTDYNATLCGCPCFWGCLPLSNELLWGNFLTILLLHHTRSNRINLLLLDHTHIPSNSILLQHLQGRVQIGVCTSTTWDERPTQNELNWNWLREKTPHISTYLRDFKFVTTWTWIVISLRVFIILKIFYLDFIMIHPLFLHNWNRQSAKSHKAPIFWQPPNRFK